VGGRRLRERRALHAAVPERPQRPRAADRARHRAVLLVERHRVFEERDPPPGGVRVDYTVNLHRTFPTLDPQDWRPGSFHADVSSNSMALEKGVIRDPSGHVLAESFHTRWTARSIS